MRLLVLLLLLSFISPAILFSQISFERTYGGEGEDLGYSVQQTADGGYIIAGFTGSLSAGGEDCYLIKTDFSGDTLHWLIGLNLDFYNVYLFAEYNVASQNSFAFGLGFGI